jgi:DNA repair exonuclease SbcCD nuclease subunit
MTQIAILGDTHFGARGDNPHFHKHFKKFYDEVFFPYLRKNNIEYVIQLGDVFDRRKFVNYQTLKSAQEYFFEPLNKEFKSWLLVGNHDTYYKNTNEVNSLSLLLNQYKNIHQVHDACEAGFDGVSILMVPWISQDNYTDILKDMEISKSQICMGHFEISGFEMHRGAICDTGLDRSTFGKFDMVISGHFHTRSKNKNIIYTGTPYQMTWADYDDIKGFHILDTTTRELKFIENPYVMFNKVFYDDLNKNMSEVLVDNFDQYKDTTVKVVIKNKTNPYWFDMFIEKLEKSGPVDLQVVEDHLNLNLEDDSDIVNEAEDTLTILNKFVDQLELNVDKQKLENLLRNLYNEALSMEIA